MTRYECLHLKMLGTICMAIIVTMIKSEKAILSVQESLTVLLDSINKEYE